MRIRSPSTISTIRSANIGSSAVFAFPWQDKGRKRPWGRKISTKRLQIWAPQPSETRVEHNDTARKLQPHSGHHVLRQMTMNDIWLQRGKHCKQGKTTELALALFDVEETLLLMSLKNLCLPPLNLWDFSGPISAIHHIATFGSVAFTVAVTCANSPGIWARCLVQSAWNFGWE